MENNSFKLKLKSLNISTIVAFSIYALFLLIVYFNKKGILKLPEIVVNNVRLFSLLIITFFVVSLILRLTVKKIVSFFDEREEQIFYSKIYIWSLYILGIIFILYNLGVSLNNLFLSFGLFATGIAFAIRDIILSFFSWMILLRKKPFRIGDYIKIGDDEGKVLHIGIFYVLLDKTPELTEDYIRVPNKLFLDKSVTNFGKNIFHDQIKFQIKEIPKNKDKLFSNLKNKCVKILDKKEDVSIFIDVNGEKIYLIVDYLVSFDQKRKIRTKLITLTYFEFKKQIMFVK